MDLIAAVFCYHISCMEKYLNSRTFHISYEEAPGRTSVLLYNFIECVITGCGYNFKDKSVKVSLSVKEHEIVLNIYQDVIIKLEHQCQNILGWLYMS